MNLTNYGAVTVTRLYTALDPNTIPDAIARAAADNGGLTWWKATGHERGDMVDGTYTVTTEPSYVIELVDLVGNGITRSIARTLAQRILEHGEQWALVTHSEAEALDYHHSS